MVEEVDFDKDVALTVVQYTLSPDIPVSEREHFAKFYVMFDKLMALGNIKRKDIPIFMLAYDEICMDLEVGLYDDARQLMGRMLMLIQLSRSEGGFQTLYGQRGIQRTESVERLIEHRADKTRPGMIKRLFKKKERRPLEEVPE